MVALYVVKAVAGNGRCWHEEYTYILYADSEHEAIEKVKSFHVGKQHYSFVIDKVEINFSRSSDPIQVAYDYWEQ